MLEHIVNRLRLAADNGAALDPELCNTVCMTLVAAKEELAKMDENAKTTSIALRFADEAAGVARLLTAQLEDVKKELHARTIDNAQLVRDNDAMRSAITCLEEQVQSRDEMLEAIYASPCEWPELRDAYIDWMNRA